MFLATSILPEYRRRIGHGAHSEVLDQIRADGPAESAVRPRFQAFTERHPEYEALLDPTGSGHGPPQ